MKWKHMTLAAMLGGMAITAAEAALELPGVAAQSDTYWAERALQAQKATPTPQAQSDALYTGKPYDVRPCRFPSSPLLPAK